jgi:hypothetical protein
MIWYDMTVWVTDWLTDWLTDSITDSFTDSLLTPSLTHSITYWLSDSLIYSIYTPLGFHFHILRFHIHGSKVVWILYTILSVPNQQYQLKGKLFVGNATADSTNLCILYSSFDDYDFHRLQFSLFIISISISSGDYAYWPVLILTLHEFSL